VVAHPVSGAAGPADAQVAGLGDETTRPRVLEMFAANGIGPNRLVLSEYEPVLSSHLERYNEVDIALDTFPYCGTTTTCSDVDGRAVITLAGKSTSSASA